MLKGIDYDKLETDEDFRREAKRLAPEALERLGKEAAEAMWKGLQKSFSLKSSEKSKFIREKTADFARDAKNKREMEKELLAMLKEEKAKQSE